MWNHREIVIDVLLDVQAHAYESSRYSNTLLVSLNNRIYFRDHPFRGVHGDSRYYVDSAPPSTFPSAVAPLTFAQNGLRTTSASDVVKLDTVSGMASIDIEKGVAIGDDPNTRFVLLSQHFGRAIQ
jgi:hypothetical protein